MKKTFLLHLVMFLAVAHLYSQKELPVFTQFGECFLNAGKCNDIKLKDSIAYIGSEAGLLILDVGDPDKAKFLSCFYTDKSPFKIFVKDTLAFVSSFAIGYPILSIINISDPKNPNLIHSFEIYEFENTSIFAQDDLLFLGMGSSGIYIYDISDLLNPEIVSHLPDIKSEDMLVVDDRIYLLAGSRYFGIIDISTVSEPEVLCWLGDYTSSRLAIDVKDNHAYVAGKTLEIFDINVPANPILVSEIEIDSDWLYDVSVSDGLCYTISNDSIFIVSVEDPDYPEVISNYRYLGSSLSIDNKFLAVTKDFNYDDPVGIGFFNIDNNQQISLTAEFTTDKARGVIAEGNYAYVANGDNGLQIIDISTPSHPVSISNCLEECHVVEAIVDNSIAYVRTVGGLKIVDVGEPELPVILSSYELPAGSANASFAIEKYHNYIYLGGNWLNEIFVIDVADPGNPMYAGQIDVYDWSPDLVIFDEHLYVAGYWGGMQIFDLHDPVTPPMIGYHPLGLALKIAVGNNKAFVVGTVGLNLYGIEIFDLSNINNPLHVGTYETTDRTDLQCIDNYLLLGQRKYQDINSSIQIVNMADLNNPVLSQEIMDVKPNGVFYQKNRIYAVEDFKFKVFGDSLTVATNDQIASNQDLVISSFPNPAINRTTIKFHVNVSGFVNLTVYSINGEIITKLISSNLSKGIYSVDWNCKNKSGHKVPSGIYLVSLQVDNFYVSEKLILTEN